MNLEGKTALVTAAGRGIGRGIAIALAEAGANVVVNSYGDDTTRATADAVEACGRSAFAFAGDITDPETIQACFRAGTDAFGQIDILVNNVGAAPKDPIATPDNPLEQTGALWDALYQQNLRPTVLMTEAVVPQMIERRDGKIIHISSIAGRTSLSGPMLKYFVHPSYGAMKAALVSYTQTLAESLGPHNINVNAVCPGIVYTDAWKRNAEMAVRVIDRFKGMDPKEWFDGIARGDYPDIFDRTPMGRDQTVEDIGNAVVFLTSSAACNVTGQSLMVDGGMVKL